MSSPNQIHFDNKEDKIFWIESIINDFEEGIADPLDIENLRSLLLEDRDARRIYLKSNRLTTLLESASASRSESRQPSSKSWTHWAAGLGIAAALAFGIWFSLQNQNSPKPTTAPAPWLATLSSSKQLVWDDPSSTSDKFYAGKRFLKSGVAELEFQNGAQVIIEGPCAFEIINGNKIELEYGKLWGHCPPSAQGFEVVTPGGNRVVDLGTEFGVDVTTTGEIEVHVFDGEVEVFPNNQEKLALDAGSALKMSPGESPHALSANAETFTDNDKLQSELFQLHRSSLLQRDDLLLYYDFSSRKEPTSTLKDLGPHQFDGQVSGAVPVRGRMADKNALLFEDRSDAVSLNLRDLSLDDGFTVAMWIKPTHFARSHMALLNSNGFPLGGIHFQIHEDGKLMTAISGVGRCASPRNTIKTNTWQFVAMSWSKNGEEAQLFLNGENLKDRKTDFNQKEVIKSINFGKCQIGAWASPSYGHNRSFEGRIDEVMIFSGQLSESEMSHLYEVSHP